ncbi:DegV family protein [Secundilactobacillus collinoides]|uniref:DegV family protein n=1 Tax=Secundilactobacillus collinoides TaxID=33960 RepID=UPI000ABD75AF|nr:DegV family protein [Secundilactobacillus collinoides]
MSIQIVTDSTVQLTEEELNDLPITVVPLVVRIGDKEYFNNGKDITNIEILSHLTGDEELPKTSQPSIGQFLEVFNDIGDAGDEVLCLNLTHHLSGTVNAARQAADITETKVTVIDSLSIDRGLRFRSSPPQKWRRTTRRWKTSSTPLSYTGKTRKSMFFKHIGKLDQGRPSQPDSGRHRQPPAHQSRC